MNWNIYSNVSVCHVLFTILDMNFFLLVALLQYVIQHEYFILLYIEVTLDDSPRILAHFSIFPLTLHLNI